MVAKLLPLVKVDAGGEWGFLEVPDLYIAGSFSSSCGAM